MVKSRGFTLIEMLLALGISAAILGGTYSLLYAGAKGWKRMRQRTELYQTGRIVLERLDNDLQNAVSVTQGQWKDKFPLKGESAALSFTTMIENQGIGIVTYT